MNICAEFEREKGGRWVATIPGVPGARSYGLTRHEAAVGVTASALHILADQVKSGQLEVIDEPKAINVVDLIAVLAEALKVSHIPNAETIASIDSGRRGEVFKANSVEEFLVALNEDDEND